MAKLGGSGIEKRSRWRRSTGDEKRKGDGGTAVLGLMGGAGVES